MSTQEQRDRAEAFRRFHTAPPMLVLPNIWDAASARIMEQAGARAIATTSSGVAAALGYADGQQISREMLLDALARITRIVTCPVTADIEAGYGGSIEEVLETVEAVIATGAVGINIEDSRPGQEQALVELAAQVELIRALRQLAQTLDVPFVINARIDVFLLGIGQPEQRAELAVERANAYLAAGADCVYPIGTLDLPTITSLVARIRGPVNILGSLGSARGPALADLAGAGVARVSFGGGVMRAILGYVRAIAQEVYARGETSRLAVPALSSAEFEGLFA